MQINTDCLYYRGMMPCVFHKADGRACKGCCDYTPIQKRILVIKLDALGDVVRTTALLPALHRHYPGLAVTWLTRSNARGFIDANPLVHQTLCVEDNYLAQVLAGQFDIGVCLDVDPLSSSVLSLARCDEKRGFIVDKFGRAVPANEAAKPWWLMGVNDDLKKRNRKTYQQIIYDICGLDSPIAPPIIPETLLNASLIDSWRQRIGDGKIVGINTGSGYRWPSKQWPEERVIEFIKLLSDAYPKVKILLYGGVTEAAFNRRVLDAVGDIGDKVINTGCDNDLGDFISLLSLSDIVVTTDSLAFHIAVGLEKTTLVLVGPTSPWELDVYGNGEVIFEARADGFCSYQPTADSSQNCMQAITPQRVLESTQRYL